MIGVILISIVDSGVQFENVLMIPIIIIMALYMVLNSYATQMVSFAYASNLIEIFKEKFENSDDKSEDEIQQNDNNL